MTVARPEGEQVRIRVRVVPIIYVITMSIARWDSLSDEDRARVVYDDAESKYTLQAMYEVLPTENPAKEPA